MAMSKLKLRTRLASLSFTEKVKILEKLRKRSAQIAAAGLRQQTAPEKSRKKQTLE